MALRGWLFCGVIAFPLAAGASLLNDLSTADQLKVKAGEQVMETETLDGYPWPKVRVYQKAAATPREVMAVFFDYDNACHYVPNCTKSQISKTLNPRSFDVDYVVDVPIFADEAYTARNELTVGPNGKLSVSWKVLHATSIEKSEGSLVVEPMGSGSLLCYTNLVKPSSRAAGLLKGIALGQMKDTVQALVSQTITQKQNATDIKRQLTRLDTALGTPKATPDALRQIRD